MAEIIHKTHAHDSGHKHVSGEAIYIDDLPEPKGLLHLYMAQSPVAHANITAMNLDPVRAFPGVVAVLSAADVPGVNDVSPSVGDDPLFADGKVEYMGQSLFVVAAESLKIARKAAKLAEISYEELDNIVSIGQARKIDFDIDDAQIMQRGDSAAALEKADHRERGHFAVGGQDHFYLEGHICLVTPMEDGDVHIFSSTQHPSEVQNLVAHVLGVPSNAVTVELRRMGGGFGGKETQPALFASAAALVAVKTGRAAKLCLDRDDDMIMTGKRHDFEIDYDVGFDDTGRITAIEFMLGSRCGYSMDLSLPVNDRAMFHADNSYYLENVTIRSRRFKTHTVSNTAFRGFGGPQGVIAIERVMDAIALRLGLDALAVRKVNLYGKTERNITPYHQTVTDNVAPEIIAELEQKSQYQKRRQEIRAFNKTSPYLKKGIALTPVKFGISFTLTHLNQAGALIHIYADGSVHLNHGGTEMGQGLFTKVAQVVAQEFQIDLERVKISSTRTDKVPNTSATAASSGSDLNGMAALNAAKILKNRLIEFAAEQHACKPENISFRDNMVYVGNEEITFADLANQAYMNRVSLSANGFYKTPKIYYDRKTHKGRPFYYYAYGAAVSEVLIDTLTGENQVTRVDILHDTGRSLNPAVDIGQIEGGFIQGMGWLTTEELVYSDKGQLMTHAPSTYKIPTCSDRPEIFNVELWDSGRNVEPTIHRSKAVGEPPLMLGISVFSAICDAVASIGDYEINPQINTPTTPEEILRSVAEIQSKVK
ncbi:MAG: xanthine dehydrogenase molybdopterin binding subunit [Emcibacter sp.]|nr:xanthine dehydrogenase molybdopterin binding subunit [Emcibacter sp.]